MLRCAISYLSEDIEVFLKKIFSPCIGCFPHFFVSVSVFPHAYSSQMSGGVCLQKVGWKLSVVVELTVASQEGCLTGSFH